MRQLVVSIIGGATLGGVFALIGIGMVLVFRATATFNFAHGQLMVLATFIVGATQANHSMPLGVAIPLSFLVVGVGAGLFYVLVLQRTAGMPHFMGVIATLGLAAILDGTMSLIYGPGTYGIKYSFLPSSVVKIFGARVSTTSLVIGATSILLAVGVALLLQFTHLGTKIRASGQDALLASQSGINVRRIFLGSWVLAGLLATAAGLMYGATNLVDLSSPAILLAVFPAILLGGLDSIPGAIVGGLAIGILQGFVASYFGGEYIDVVTYTLLLLVLLVRPVGLFGTPTVTRV